MDSLLNSTHEIIRQHESELRQAQLTSDVAALDRLIDDALMFTGPDGSIASKADDLAMHAAKVVRFTTHEPTDPRILQVSPDVVVVAVRTRLAGEFNGQNFDGMFRYTRVWVKRDAGWRIIAGHVSAA